MNIVSSRIRLKSLRSEVFLELSINVALCWDEKSGWFFLRLFAFGSFKDMGLGCWMGWVCLGSHFQLNEPAAVLHLHVCKHNCNACSDVGKLCISSKPCWLCRWWLSTGWQSEQLNKTSFPGAQWQSQECGSSGDKEECHLCACSRWRHPNGGAVAHQSVTTSCCFLPRDVPLAVWGQWDLRSWSSELWGQLEAIPWPFTQCHKHADCPSSPHPCLSGL